MKKWTLLTGALALSLSQTTLSAGTHSAVGSASVPAPLSLQVGQTPFQDEQTQSVSIIEAVQTRGKVLPIVLGRFITASAAVSSSRRLNLTTSAKMTKPPLLLSLIRFAMPRKCWKWQNPAVSPLQR